MAEPHPIPSDPRFQDLTGRSFGKLTVLFYAGKKSDKYSTWHCRCECGREQTIVTSQLTLGQTKSCTPCFRHAPRTKTRTNFEDLTGQVFGRLTVLQLDHRDKRENRTYWLCKCSCGETTVARADSLKRGTTKSCGCMNVSRQWIDVPRPETAVCRKCKKSFPLDVDHFRPSPRARYGFFLICRTCFLLQKNAWGRKEARALRMAALIAYAGEPPCCQCPGCSEGHVEFLSIDHIAGGGNRHRKTLPGGFYRWLRQNNYPSGFRVLCMNCNFSLGKYGYCPHQKS